MTVLSLHPPIPHFPASTKETTSSQEVRKGFQSYAQLKSEISASSPVIVPSCHLFFIPHFQPSQPTLGANRVGGKKDDYVGYVYFMVWLFHFAFYQFSVSFWTKFIIRLPAFEIDVEPTDTSQQKAKRKKEKTSNLEAEDDEKKLDFLYFLISNFRVFNRSATRPCFQLVLIC